MPLADAKNNTVHDLRGASLLQEQSGAGDIPRRRLAGPAPLSYAQQELWLRARSLSHLPPFFNESITVYRSGPLDVAALERSLAEIIRRHEIWRTTLDTVDGQPVQIVHPAPAILPLPLVDLRGLPEVEREAEALRLASEEARRPFDLNLGPLLRATLTRLGEQDYRLFMIMHQTILDGVSVYHVFLPELVILYEAFSVGKPSPLPDPPIQYADYALWHREWLQGETLANQVAYWQKQLAGDPPVLQLPTDRPRSTTQTFRGVIQPFVLPKKPIELLQVMSQREGSTLFMALLAAFSVLLHRYTRQTDIIVGTVSPSGRKRIEVQGLLGYFLNPVALRIDLGGNPTFRDVLRRARNVTLDALCHDDVPFEYLVRELQPKLDPSRNPFFQVAISLEPPMPSLDSGWNLTPMDAQSGGARWDIYLVVDNRPSGPIGRVQYNPDLFDAATIMRMLEHYQALLESIASNPELRLSDFPKLTTQDLLSLGGEEKLSS